MKGANTPVLWVFRINTHPLLDTVCVLAYLHGLSSWDSPGKVDQALIEHIHRYNWWEMAISVSGIVWFQIQPLSPGDILLLNIVQALIFAISSWIIDFVSVIIKS